jgi:hypothetical protein
VAYPLGCGPSCDLDINEPACAARFGATRAVSHSFGQGLQDHDAVVDEAVGLRGDVDLGVGWSTFSLESSLILGFPDTSAVGLFPPLDAVGSCPASTTRSLSWVPDPTVRAQPEITFRTSDCGEETQVAFTGPGDFGAAVVGIPSDDGWDLWVGAPSQGVSRGAVYRFRSAPNRAADRRDAETADGAWEGRSPGEQVGRVLRRCGDVTGDGAPDLAIGAPGPSDPEGTGFVYLVDPAQTVDARSDVSVFSTSLSGITRGSRTGAALWCDGDLDGDGRADLLIGAPGAGAEGEGAFWYVSSRDLPFLGSLDEVARQKIDGTEVGEGLGSAIEVADLDLDGVPELVVGAPGYNQGVGAVLVWTGLDRRTSPWNTPDVWEGRPAEAVDGIQAKANLGGTLAVADLDRDGLPEVLAGAWRADRDGALHAGEVLIWPGSILAAGGGGGAQLATSLRGASSHQEVGRTLWVADLDGDGVPDVLTQVRRRLR